MVKKGCLVVLGIFLIGLVALIWLASDPEVQKWVDDERKAGRKFKPPEAKEQREAREQKVAKKLQEDGEEAWSKWEREKTNDAELSGVDDGFRLGFKTARLYKYQFEPTAASVEKMAHVELGKQRVENDRDVGFIRGFKAGWSSGWRQK